MRIPEVRDRLHVLADECHIPELHDLADELKRRPNGNRAKAPVSSRHWTPEDAEAVRAWKRANPRMSMVRIAAIFDTNQARVSEAIYGKRT